MITRTLFLTLSLASIHMLQAQNFNLESTEKWNNGKDYLVAIAEAMPEGQYDFKPTPEEMTFSAQLIHIAGNMVRLSTAYLEYTDQTPPEISSKEAKPQEIKKYLQEAFDFASAAIQAQDETSLNIVAEKFFAGPKSRRQIIFLLNDHVTHHRGQLIVYLRLNEIKPPSYKGW